MLGNFACFFIVSIYCIKLTVCWVILHAFCLHFLKNENSLFKISFMKTNRVSNVLDPDYF